MLIKESIKNKGKKGNNEKIYKSIIKYYFDDKNEYEIAEEEKTTQQAINKSLNKALKNLEKKLKNCD